MPEKFRVVICSPGAQEEALADLEPEAVTLDVEEFLTWMTVERGRSANTLISYRRDLTGYCRWLAAAGTDSARARATALPMTAR